MSDEKQTGSEEQTTQTGSAEAATEDQKNSEAATGADKSQSSDKNENVETKDDEKNLVSQRDKNFNRAITAEERLGYLEYTLAKQEAVNELVQKYPDVPRKVIESAASKEEAESLAKEFAAYGEKMKQKALEELQTVNEIPPLDKKTADAMLKEAKEKGDFEGMIEIKQRMGE